MKNEHSSKPPSPFLVPLKTKNMSPADINMIFPPTKESSLGFPFPLYGTSELNLQ